MSQVLVRDSFFDIVLTSDAYQDIFPENTVSFFRAKLPAKLVLPQQLRYKVALYKLNYINSTNNIGKGANTRMVISTDKYHGATVHFPDICVDDVSEFIQILIAQMKQTIPDLFNNHPDVKFAISPKYSPPVINVVTQEQADQTLNQNEEAIINEYKQLVTFVDQLMTIVLNKNFDSEELYLKFKMHYDTKLVDTLRKALRKTNWTKIVFKHFPNDDAILNMKLIGILENVNNVIKKLDKIFYETPFKPQQWSETFKQIKTIFNEKPKIRQKWEKAKDHFFVPINHDGVDEMVYIHAFETFRSMWKNPKPIEPDDENAHIKTIMQDMALTDFAIEIDKNWNHLNLQIQIHKNQLQKTVVGKPLYNKIAKHLILLIKLYNYINKSYLAEIHFIERKIKLTDAFERRPEDAVINPDTQDVFKTEQEWINYMQPIYSQRGELISDFRQKEHIYNKGISQYWRKISEKIITPDYPPDAELTGDEIYYRRLEKAAIEDHKRKNEIALQPYPPSKLEPFKTKAKSHSPQPSETKIIPQQRASTPQRLTSSPPPPTLESFSQTLEPQPTPEIISQISTPPVPKPKSPTPPIPKPKSPTPPIPEPEPDLIGIESQSREVTISLISQPSIPQPATPLSQTLDEDEDEEIEENIIPSTVLLDENPKFPKISSETKILWAKKRPHDDQSSTFESKVIKLDDFDPLNRLLEISSNITRERWDTISYYKSTLAFGKEEEQQLLILAQIPRALGDNNDLETRIAKQINFITRVASPAQTFRIADSFAELEIDSSEIMKDFQYYYHNFKSYTELLQMIRYLAFNRRNHLINLVASFPPDEKTAFDIKFRAFDVQTKLLSGNTHIQQFANLLRFKTDSPYFDFGLSLELLSMMGWMHEERFLENNFIKRQNYRLFLQTLIRTSEQITINAYSVTNYFITGINHLVRNNVSFESQVDGRTNSKIDTILDAKYILCFKNFFMNKGFRLRLDLQDSMRYKQYMHFLSKFVKITHIEFAWSVFFLTLGHQMENSIDYWYNENEFREYLDFFYGQDIGMQKRLSKTKWHLTPILDIDLITFAFWKCAKEMPLCEEIISLTPPKLNPMAQFWVYTNIIQDSIVNNDFKKLLAIGTTKQEHMKGNENEITFQEPLFKNLNTNILDEIEILIATKFGNPVPFVDGPLTVQLLFKRELM
jgi:hypothetical protein